LCPADDAARQAKTAELGYDRYDDQTLLRFLRARKFDLPAAQLMWENNEKWRTEFGADQIAAYVFLASSHDDDSSGIGRSGLSGERLLQAAGGQREREWESSR
jgi:hypothetical protein